MTSASERSVCYQARDAYFACLDKHGIISASLLTSEQLTTIRYKPKEAEQNPPIPVQKMPDECAKLRVEFVKSCAKSWVSHFEGLREREAVVRHMEKQGARPLNEGMASR